MKYLHEVGAGPCDMKSGYGLLMAEQSGFPRSVLQDARQLRSVVRDQFPVLVRGGGGEGGSNGGSGGADAAGTNNNSSVAAVTSLLQHLLLLKTTMTTAASSSDRSGGDREDTSAARQYLQSLRDRIPDSAAQDMLLWLRHNSSTSADTSDIAVPGEGAEAAEEGGSNGDGGRRAEVRSVEPPSKVPRTTEEI